MSSPQHALPPRPAAPAPARKKPKGGPRYGRRWAIILAVIAAAVITIVALNSGPSASWKATVQGFTVTDPADISVSFRVTDTGKAAGTPDCTVDAQSPTGSYSGVNEGTLSNSVAPGSSVVTAMPVTITGQGARFVTQVQVTCQ